MSFLSYLVKKKSVILNNLVDSIIILYFKIKNINIAKDWKQWYIKTDSKLFISLKWVCDFKTT